MKGMEGYLRGTFDVARYRRSLQIAAQEAGFVVEHCYGHHAEPILALRRVCLTPKAHCTYPRNTWGRTRRTASASADA
jgi:hypothetical protein